MEAIPEHLWVCRDLQEHEVGYYSRGRGGWVSGKADITILLPFCQRPLPIVRYAPVPGTQANSMSFGCEVCDGAVLILS